MDTPPTGARAGDDVPLADSALLTDLYQLTMAYGYWQRGRHEQQAAFHLYFRSPPFGSGYTVACGIEPALDYLARFRFTVAEVAYLATLAGADGSPLFSAEFLEFLGELRLTLDVDAVAEGTVVFPNEPLLRVRGSLLQAQLVETALLAHVGFQTLVATKAARVCLAAGDGEVLEFGLRRAQGPDGGLGASRAAYVGGCSSTSNVLAGMRFGIPVRGTHAHSWVMVFDDEAEAFAAYADSVPNNVVLLVDTYDTLGGVARAIETGRLLRARGHRLLGVRLDSGDLGYLSVEARRLLDEAGFHDTAILASNELDEHVITSLRQQRAAITIWGVGTRLVTAYDQPSLGTVYKLTAVQEAGGAWVPRVKVSEQTAKTTIPGLLQVRRYHEPEPTEARGAFAGDMIVDESRPVPEGAVTMLDPLDPTRWKSFADGCRYTELLQPAIRGGRRVRAAESLHDARARAQRELRGFHAGVKRLLNPHRYPVGLEAGLHALRTELILAARGGRD